MKNDYIEVNSCVLFDHQEYNHLGAISSIYIFFDKCWRGAIVRRCIF